MNQLFKEIEDQYKDNNLRRWMCSLAISFPVYRNHIICCYASFTHRTSVFSGLYPAENAGPAVVNEKIEAN